MRNKKNVAEVRCQRCNEMGHWTYQCTNPPAYNYRPSRMMQYKESQLRYKLNEDEGPKGPKITDGDKRRTVKQDKDSDLEQLVNKLIENESSSSSISSSSSSSSNSSNSSDYEQQSQDEQEKVDNKKNKAKKLSKDFKEDQIISKNKQQASQQQQSSSRKKRSRSRDNQYKKK